MSDSNAFFLIGSLFAYANEPRSRTILFIAWIQTTIPDKYAKLNY